ncbi:MAG TPA: cytochrome c oxidase subunit II [Terriglobia bacterium]|nr:cytochrome c oxidase subunit II [Terriglobia bacterium]
MKRGTTIYLYELAWILPSAAIPVGMLVALLVTAFGVHIHMPGIVGRVNPNKIDSTPPFDHPGLVPLGPGRYEVDMVAQTWSFNPAEIRVPADSQVTFVITSRDVVHGFFIPRTATNIMVLPGQIARITAHFGKPGTYPFLCHEYCGLLHHMMAGQVVVLAQNTSAQAGAP